MKWVALFALVACNTSPLPGSVPRSSPAGKADNADDCAEANDCVDCTERVGCMYCDGYCIDASDDAAQCRETVRDVSLCTYRCQEARSCVECTSTRGCFLCDGFCTDDSIALRPGCGEEIVAPQDCPDAPPPPPPCDTGAACGDCNFDAGCIFCDEACIPYDVECGGFPIVRASDCF